MDADQPGERHYRARIEFIKSRGIERLGLMTAWAWYDDPRRLTFTFARYKFVANMLSGLDKVLEVGCGDGFATRVVAQSVGNVTAVDFDPEFIADANSRRSDAWPIEFRTANPMEGPIEGEFDAAYALDVLEHVRSEDEHRFIQNMIDPVREHGMAIIGMPSLESQAYASPQSREGHVNCKKQNDLKALMKQYFYNVLAFSMNDEVVHTGFSSMAHYNIVVCCGKRN
jgi:2-polyprenyl-3-methyl-5-hydroxy-6-metoxy-1,4-benzoquinol methylase